MSSENRHDALVKALVAISGVNGVPYCLLPMLAGQTLCVPTDFATSPVDGEKRELAVYTDAGLETGKTRDGQYRDMTMSEVLVMIEREGRDGLVIDPGLPHRLSVRGKDLMALRSQVAKSGLSGMRRPGPGSESIECETGSELVIAAPDPVPSDVFIQMLKAALRTGGRFNRAWLFETILPGNSAGELCVGVEPAPDSNFGALERCIGDVAQKYADQLAGRSSLAFLPLQESELIDVVKSVGLPLHEGEDK